MERNIGFIGGYIWGVGVLRIFFNWNGVFCFFFKGIDILVFKGGVWKWFLVVKLGYCLCEFFVWLVWFLYYWSFLENLRIGYFVLIVRVDWVFYVCGLVMG